MLPPGLKSLPALLKSFFMPGRGEPFDGLRANGMMSTVPSQLYKKARKRIGWFVMPEEVYLELNRVNCDEITGVDDLSF